MAFAKADFQVIGGQTGSGPKFCVYTSTDALTVIRVADYFLELINTLEVNDTILIVSASGGTPVLSLNYVNSNTGSAIDVTDGLVITATDTD